MNSVSVSTASRAPATVAGQPLEDADHPLGTLRSTDPRAGVETLREVMEEEGYLYLPGFFDRADVLAVRRDLTTRLSGLGMLAAGTDPMDGIMAEGDTRVPIDQLNQRLAVDNPALQGLLYGERMMNFFADFLGGPALHFDYTWIRATPPGRGTQAHTDKVFMGRGTPRLYTTWVPYGDVPIELGGLAVLEQGFRHDVVREYAEHDVDSYCENTGEEPTVGPNPDRSLLDSEPLRLRARLGGQWRTASYRAGDVIIFGMLTPHVGIDNTTRDRLRLSSDSRYQLASEQADERWIGPDPVGHGPGAKRGLIC